MWVEGSRRRKDCHPYILVVYVYYKHIPSKFN